MSARDDLRDAIARMLFYGLDSSRNVEAADAILALPEMQRMIGPCAPDEANEEGT